MTLTARALNMLKMWGYEAQVVEKWIPQAKRRIDLFNCIDIVAVNDGEILGVQVTSASNFSSRRAKILASPGARKWVSAGGKLLLWGFRKVGKRWDPVPRQKLFSTDDWGTSAEEEAFDE